MQGKGEMKTYWLLARLDISGTSSLLPSRAASSMNNLQRNSVTSSIINFNVSDKAKDYFKLLHAMEDDAANFFDDNPSPNPTPEPTLPDQISNEDQNASPNRFN